MRPTPEQIQALTDADLEGLRNDVVAEQNRRVEVALLPHQIDVLIQKYVNQGGDKSKIRDPKGYEKGPMPPGPPMGQLPNQPVDPPVGPPSGGTV